MPRESLTFVERLQDAAAGAWSAAKENVVVGTVVFGGLLQAAVTQTVSAQERTKPGPAPAKQEKKEEKIDTVDQAVSFLTNALGGGKDLQTAWRHLERFEPDSVKAVIGYMDAYDPGPLRVTMCRTWLSKRAAANPAVATAVLSRGGSHAVRILTDAGPSVVPLLLEALERNDSSCKTAMDALCLLGTDDRVRGQIAEKLSAHLTRGDRKESSNLSRTSAYVLFSLHQWEALRDAAKQATPASARDVYLSAEFALKEAGGEFYPIDPKRMAKVKDGIIIVLSAYHELVPVRERESAWQAYRDSVAQWERTYAPKKD